MAFYSAQNIHKYYGAVAALKAAHLHLEPGEVHALVGENGAGKSTLARIIAGVTTANVADISINGHSASVANPREAQKLGISIILQELDLFPHLSAGENIVIGNAAYAETWRSRIQDIERFCRPVLDQVGLACGIRDVVASFSIAQQQLLAIARALSMNARVLIMDEPTSSLPQGAVERLFDLIAALKARGVAIVYVSHKMEEIFRISDKITVMRDGETVGTCDASATTSEQLIGMMVGRSLDRSIMSRGRAQRKVVLSVSGLTTHKLQEVDFELHSGEVLGIAGLVGSGRSELGAALFGLDRIHRGTLYLNGDPFLPIDPAHAMRNGMALLPEDRKLQGLMMHMSVRENATFSILSRVSRLGFVRRALETELMDVYSKRLRLKCASHAAAVGTLSGGNQQKALITRVLLADPDVIFLDDPARGIDVGAKEDIYQLIDELAKSGKGVILVSSELPELLRCADRILVVNQGHVAGILDPPEATQERIMALSTAPLGKLKRAS